MSLVFVIDIFLTISIFKALYFQKKEAVFWQNLHKCTQDLKKFIKQIIVVDHKGKACKMCDSVRQKFGHMYQ